MDYRQRISNSRNELYEQEKGIPRHTEHSSNVMPSTSTSLRFNVENEYIIDYSQISTQIRKEQLFHFMNLVELQFSHTPEVYNEFVNMLRQHIAGHIDKQSILIRLNDLFKERPELITQFNYIKIPSCNLKVQRGQEIGRQKTICQVPVIVPNSMVMYPTTLTQPNNTSNLIYGNDNLDFQASYKDINHFLYLIKHRFSDKPEMYHELLNILMWHTLKHIDNQSTLIRVNHLFKEHPDLIIKFNNMHSARSKSKTQPDKQISIYQEPVIVPSSTVTQPSPSTQFNNTNSLEQESDNLAFVTLKKDIHNFISLVKQQFNDNFKVYHEFLNILLGHTMGHVDMRNISTQVNYLFREHPDLITKFNKLRSTMCKPKVQPKEQEYVSQTPVNVPGPTTMCSATLPQYNNTNSLECGSDTQYPQRKNKEVIIDFLYLIIQKFNENLELRCTFINMYRDFKLRKTHFQILENRLRKLLREYPELIIKFNNCFLLPCHRSEVKSNEQKHINVPGSTNPSVLSQHNNINCLQHVDGNQHSKKSNDMVLYTFLNHVMQKLSDKPLLFHTYINICKDFALRQNTDFEIMENQLRDLFKQYSEIIGKFNDCLSSLHHEPEMQPDKEKHIYQGPEPRPTTTYAAILSEYNNTSYLEHKSSIHHSQKNNEDIIDLLYLMIQIFNNKPELLYPFIEICKNFTSKRSVNFQTFDYNLRNLLKEYPQFIIMFNNCLIYTQHQSYKDMLFTLPSNTINESENSLVADESTCVEGKHK